MRRRFRDGVPLAGWPLMVVDVKPTRSPAELYRAARANGWTEGEARNLQAYSLGLAIAGMRPWTKRQLDVAQWLKWLHDAGRV